MQLSGRVEKARAETKRRRNPEPVANRRANRLQSRAIFRRWIDISLDHYVVAFLLAREPCRNRATQTVAVACVNFTFDPGVGFFSARARVHRLLRQVLGELHVRLIEWVDPKRRARRRDSKFPTKEFLA